MSGQNDANWVKVGSLCAPPLRQCSASLSRIGEVIDELVQRDSRRGADTP